MKVIQLFLFTVILFFSISLSAQSGKYDVRLSLFNVDCNTAEVFFDVEVKATSDTETFNIANQSYRFSFSRPDVILNSLGIDTELCISSFVTQSTPSTTSFYGGHTLAGSIDTVVSLNISLSGGDGYFIDDDVTECGLSSGDGWVLVSRLKIQMTGTNSNISFFWHTQAPGDFPPTSIFEKFNNQFFSVAEGNYTNLTVDLNAQCASTPISLKHFSGFEKDCNIILEWATENEENNNYFILKSSKDALNFNEIGRINGNGTSSVSHNYSFTSDEVNNEITYFKLIQVDLDGKVNEHKIIAVKSSCYSKQISNQIIKVFPNPVSDESAIINIELFLNKPEELLDFIITDVLGRQVDQFSYSCEKGINNIIYDLSLLPEGTYYINCRGDNWQTNYTKLIKVKL